MRELIGNLRTVRGFTIEEILAHLRQMQVHVGRTALAKHTRQLDAVAEQVKRSRMMGEALIERLGGAPEPHQARINVEPLQSLIMDLLVAGEGGKPVQLTPQNAKLLSDALAKLALASKADMELRAAMATAAAARAVEVAERAGLSAETVARFRAAILGLATRGAARVLLGGPVRL